MSWRVHARVGAAVLEAQDPATTTRYPQGRRCSRNARNSREIDTAALQQDLNALLVEGEEMQRAFRSRLFIFTNRDQPLLG